MANSRGARQAASQRLNKSRLMPTNAQSQRTNGPETIQKRGSKCEKYSVSLASPRSGLLARNRFRFVRLVNPEFADCKLMYSPVLNLLRRAVVWNNGLSPRSTY